MSSGRSSEDVYASGSGGASGEQQKKRKVPASITLNACTSCKKARAKCDGEKPRCGRCVHRGQASRCEYELHVKVVKRDMVRKIKDLQEKDNYVELILSSLKYNEEASDVLNRLRKGESYQSIAKTLGEPHKPPIPGIPLDLSPDSQLRLSRTIRDYQIDAARERDPDSGLIQGGHWTNVTHDAALIEHLFALYFTWAHPVHMLFSQTHFTASYRQQSNLYCTSALVNAICAMGCNYFDASEEHNPQGLDPVEMRERFMDEARSLLTPEQCRKLTAMQALAIMFLTELCSAKGSRAASYLSTAATELKRSLDSEYSTEVTEITRWGIYTLCVAWGEFTFQVPAEYLIPKSINTPTFTLGGIDDPIWCLYRYSEDDIEGGLPSVLAQTATSYTRLLRIVHDTSTVFYDGAGTRIYSREVLQHYTRYLTWFDELSPEIKDIYDDVPIVPHVLSLHIQYYTALVLLFCPLLHVQAFSSATVSHLTSITYADAWKGFTILRRYRELYTCRYQPPLQAFCALHICDFLLRFAAGPLEATEILKFGLEVLRENEDGLGGLAICGPLQQSFCQTAVECNIHIPDNFKNLTGSSPKYRASEMLDATARLRHTQPVGQVIANLDPAIVQDFAEEWKRFVELRSEGLEKEPQEEKPQEEKPSAGRRRSGFSISDLLNG